MSDISYTALIEEFPSMSTPEDDFADRTDKEQRWYNDTDDPREVVYYQFYPGKSDLSFSITKPEAGHGLRVSDYVAGVDDSVWTDEMKFTASADGLVVTYSFDDQVFERPVDDVVQAATVLRAKEAWDFGATEPGGVQKKFEMYDPLQDFEEE